MSEFKIGPLNHVGVAVPDLEAACETYRTLYGAKDITTPFDMSVLNDLDRFHLAGDVIDRLPQLGTKASHVKQALRDKLIEHYDYIRQHGEDLPEIRDWKWTGDLSA